MSLVITLKGVSFNNPNLPVVDISKHPAESGLVAGFPMNSIINNQYIDVVGGFNAQLGDAHTCIQLKEGIQIPDQRLNDNCALTSISSVNENTTYFALVRKDVSRIQGFILGAWNFAGFGFFPVNETNNMGFINGNAENYTGPGISVNVGSWVLLVAKYENNRVTFRELLSNYTEQAVVINFRSMPLMIGGYMGTDSSKSLPPQGITYGFCGMYNKVLSDTEEKYLVDYLRVKMAERGVLL